MKFDFGEELGGPTHDLSLCFTEAYPPVIRQWHHRSPRTEGYTQQFLCERALCERMRSCSDASLDRASDATVVRGGVDNPARKRQII